MAIISYINDSQKTLQALSNMLSEGINKGQRKNRGVAIMGKGASAITKHRCINLYTNLL